MSEKSVRQELAETLESVCRLESDIDVGGWCMGCAAPWNAHHAGCNVRKALDRHDAEPDLDAAALREENRKLRALLKAAQNMSARWPKMTQQARNGGCASAYNAVQRAIDACAGIPTDDGGGT